MNYKKHLVILSIILATLTLWSFFYKITVLHLPLLAGGDSTVWTVEARIHFDAQNKPVKINFAIPPEQPNFARLDENFVSRKYGATITQVGDNRIATLSIRRASDAQTLYYRTQFYIDEVHLGPALSGRGADMRTVYEGAKAAAAQTIVHQVRETSADSLTFATELVHSLLNTADDNVSLLLDRDYSTENIAKKAQALLLGPSKQEGPNITSRMVHGFRLTNDVEARRNISLEIYLAVWDTQKNTWHYINPANAMIGLPHNFLIWQYGDEPFVRVEGGTDPTMAFSFTQQLHPSIDIAHEEAAKSRSFLMDFSLFSLPLQTQQLYQILIMIPLGALVVLIMRSFIGIQTFGTFMPVLIAIAFRETDLFSGILLFALIVTIGLSLRFYLEHLKLLLIPRLSVVLSGVVLIMMALSILSHRMGMSYGLSFALFPMVIITMTIERMSIEWEERGAWVAIKQALGSLLCATLSYIVMTNGTAEHILFVFPELILLVVVFMLWIGHYHGYRLSELFRFKDLTSKQ